MKKLYQIQSFQLCFVGVGALFGGTMGISSPNGTLYGTTTEVLKKGPFNNFLIPSLFLFFIIGVGQLIAFGFVKRKLKYHVYISGAEGCILMGWLVIQCFIIEAVGFLHVLFFLLGLVESLIALYMLIKLKLFPISLLIKE